MPGSTTGPRQALDRRAPSLRTRSTHPTIHQNSTATISCCCGFPRPSILVQVSALLVFLRPLWQQVQSAGLQAGAHCPQEVAGPASSRRQQWTSRRMRSATATMMELSPMICSAPMATTTEAQQMLARVTAAAPWCASMTASGLWRVRHLGDMAVPTRHIQACGLKSLTTSIGSRRRVVCSQFCPIPLQLLHRLLRHPLLPLELGNSPDLAVRWQAAASAA